MKATEFDLIQRQKEIEHTHQEKQNSIGVISSKPTCRLGIAVRLNPLHLFRKQRQDIVKVVLDY